MAALTGRALIAARCAKFFKNGDFVNLGIGVPLMCVNYLPEGVDLWLEAEIGTVGSGASRNGKMQTSIASMLAASRQRSSRAAAYMIMKLHLHLSAAVISMLPYWVHCKSTRKATLLTGRFLASSFLVWAVLWICAPA